MYGFNLGGDRGCLEDSNGGVALGDVAKLCQLIGKMFVRVEL